MAMFDECIWCAGNPVECAVCAETIVCMFCLGSGEFTPAPQLTAHVCPLGLSTEPVAGRMVQ